MLLYGGCTACGFVYFLFGLLEVFLLVDDVLGEGLEEEVTSGADDECAGIGEVLDDVLEQVGRESWGEEDGP